jgi:DNA repair exonuclease SbcCD nuclease subunit
MIVTADFHLGLTSDSVATGPLGIASKIVDTQTRLLEAIQVASKEADKTLVIPGDLFNKYILDPLSVEVALRAFKFARKEDVEVYILPGNHDCDARWSSTVLAKEMGQKNIHVIDSPDFVSGVGIFLPHLPRSKEIAFLKKEGSYRKFFANLMKGVEGRHVLFSHAHVRGATNAQGFEVGESGTAMVFNPKEFPSRWISIAVLGHIHRHQELKGSWGYPIVYTGPVITTNFGEADVPKGFVRVDSSSGKWSFHEFTSQVREYRHVKINLVGRQKMPELDDAKVKAVAEGKLLKVTIFAKSAFQVDEIGIKKVFNKYGEVLRMEYKIDRSEPSPKVDAPKGTSLYASGSVNHTSLLKQYVSKADAPKEIKDLAVKIGKEVIEECSAT